MNIVIRIDQYDDKCIYFCEPIKNNIMNDGNFIRILYTNSQVTLNGVHLFIKLNDILCEKYYNKYKCNFDIETHRDIIDNLKVIEENILKKLNVKEKIPQYKIYEQIKNGNIKIFNDIGNKSSSSFILKISGIWETLSNFGLTYKFVKVD
jgi:Zn-dependent M16 (insulinase) family peptidase